MALALLVVLAVIAQMPSGHAQVMTVAEKQGIPTRLVAVLDIRTLQRSLQATTRTDALFRPRKSTTSCMRCDWLTCCFLVRRASAMDALVRFSLFTHMNTRTTHTHNAELGCFAGSGRSSLGEYAPLHVPMRTQHFCRVQTHAHQQTTRRPLRKALGYNFRSVSL